MLFRETPQSDMLSCFKDVNLSLLVVLYEYSYEYNTRV